MAAEDDRKRHVREQYDHLAEHYEDRWHRYVDASNEQTLLRDTRRSRSSATDQLAMGADDRGCASWAPSEFVFHPGDVRRERCGAQSGIELVIRRDQLAILGEGQRQVETVIDRALQGSRQLQCAAQ